MTVTWTGEAIRGLGVQTDIITAGSIFGLGETTARTLAREGRFPVPVLRCGAKYVVPVAPILAVLGIDEGTG